MNATRGFLHSLARSLFAGSCFLCRDPADANAPGGLLCRACEADLPSLQEPCCPVCALPGFPDPCPGCANGRRHFDATHAALAYDFPSDVLVQSLKFRGELAVAALLADVLRPALAGAVDVIVPVPLSTPRMRERGYNQALEIARALHRPQHVDAGLLLRERDTPAQADLPWSERLRNMKDAFRCTRALPGLRVAVVDDVMTTGATLDEAAKALKAAGAAYVCNWVPVRTLPPD